MSKQSIPNNPVVLLQRNAQILRTIISQADEHTSITAFMAMQKCNDEAIKIIETHDKTDAFTIVPKQVVSLCRRTIEGNVATLKRGIQEHGENQQFVKVAEAKLNTYRSILDRLPTSELPAETPKPTGSRAMVKLSAKTSFEVERKAEKNEVKNKSFTGPSREL